MRLAKTAFLLSLLSCDNFVSLNPLYCDESVACATGQICVVAHHRCVDPGDPSLPGGPPRVTGIDPAVVPSTGGTTVTLRGENFVPGMQVIVGESPIAANFVSATELQFAAPPGLGRCTETIVSATTGAGGQSVSGQARLRFRMSALVFAPRDGGMAVGTGASAIATGQLNPGSDNIMDYAISFTTHPMNVSATKFVSNGGSYVTSNIGNVGHKNILIHDVDDDKVLDFVLRNDSKVDMFAGTSISALTVPHNSTAIALADVNNDKRQDLFVYDGVLQQVYLALMSPTMFTYSGFTSVFSTDNVGKAILADDLSGDGLTDVVVGDGNSFVYALGLGGTTFQAPAALSISGAPAHLRSSDLNGDGGKELIIATDNASGGVLAVKRYQNGAWMDVSTTTISPSPKFMLLGDLDCDGLTDAAIYQPLMTTLKVYTNNGNGGFSDQGLTVQLENDAIAMALAPLGTQGKQDILLVRSDGVHLVLVNNSQ